MDDEACEILTRQERPDDPVGNPRVTAILERFEDTLAGVMATRDRTTAVTLVHTFSRVARTHASGAWELALVRRLELSSEISVLLRFDNDVSRAAQIAEELVSLPCHRRMAQLWEVLILAGYCRDRGHPEAIWPFLVKAVMVVETEIPNNEGWLADRQRIRGILAELWNSMGDEARASLIPYMPKA